MAAKLNTAITAARDHPQRGRVASVLTKLFNATDAARPLTAGADHEIRNLKSPRAWRLKMGLRERP